MSRPEALFCRSRPWRTLAGPRLTRWALQDTDLHGDILEVGAGSGAMAQQVLVAHLAIRMTATDLDPAMVNLLARRLPPSVRTLTADATALPFDAESFDTVLSFLMLHHVVGWELALAEFARVLRPGGRLLAYDFHDRLIPRLIHTLDRSPHRLIAERELSPALTSAGFAVDRIRVSHAGNTFRVRATRGADR